MSLGKVPPISFIEIHEPQQVLVHIEPGDLLLDIGLKGVVNQELLFLILLGPLHPDALTLPLSPLQVGEDIRHHIHLDEVVEHHEDEAVTAHLGGVYQVVPLPPELEQDPQGLDAWVHLAVDLEEAGVDDTADVVDGNVYLVGF